MSARSLGAAGRDRVDLNHFIKSIWNDRKTRRVFIFLLLNISFTLVELVYGYISNSLGLIGDGLHMMFDNSAIILSLAASVIAKWEPTPLFSYGYGRVELFTGLLNCAFLVYASGSIIMEAAERLFTQPEIESDHLLAISVTGFLVNLVGIFAFDSHSMHHGHGHHGNCDHQHHSHEHLNHSHGTDDTRNKGGGDGDTVLMIDQHNHHSHSHHHHHHHSHHHSHHHGNNALMHGMFLHVMADALGSLGVITSSLLIQYFGWTRADSICSLFIAGLILVSTWPLLKQCSLAMLQCTPAAIYDQLPVIYNKIRLVPGVLTFTEPHFWELSSERYVGTIKVVVDKPGDEQVIRSHILNIFAQYAPNIRWLVVEICKDTVTL